MTLFLLDTIIYFIIIYYNTAASVLYAGRVHNYYYYRVYMYNIMSLDLLQFYKKLNNNKRAW